MLNTTTTHDRPSVSALLLRARSEFLEMPGLRLTIAQAARLWGLDRMTSECLLNCLVATGFLWRRRDGAYLRVSAESGE
jgi:hypothetical protein